jgi:hypothetical protein
MMQLVLSFVDEKWVLIITLLANSEPVSITNVPGYATLDACAHAGHDAKSQAKLDGYDVTFVCISGPEK